MFLYIYIYIYIYFDNPRAATCVNMRTVSTMALDLQMFDSEDVASVVDLDVDTGGEVLEVRGGEVRTRWQRQESRKRQEEGQRQESRHGGDSSW